jgi:tryptophanase
VHGLLGAKQVHGLLGGIAAMYTRGKLALYGLRNLSVCVFEFTSRTWGSLASNPLPDLTVGLRELCSENGSCGQAGDDMNTEIRY